MHAKVSKAGLRFFAHDRVSPQCPSNGETPAHRELKSAIAATARSVGLAAEIEAAGSGWRADVLVTELATGRRVAFEAQLAAMTGEVGRERTDRYAAGDVEAVWVSNRTASWLFEVPGIKVAVSGVPTVELGCAKWSRWWSPAPAITLATFMRSLFAGRLERQQLDGWLEVTLNRGDRMVDRPFQSPVVWVKRSEWVEYQEHRRRQEAEWEKQRRDAETHRANIAALAERQQRLVPLAVERAKEQTGLTVWAGEQEKWYAMGVPIFYRNNHRLSDGEHLWGVVCPVASRVGSWAQYKWRSVTVVAADERERRRLDQAMHGAGKVIVLGDNVTEP
jgi:hypothetical protein